MTSIFSSNFNTINATSTFGGTLFNNLGSGSYGSTSGLFNGNTYGSSGLFGSNFGYGGYGYFGNTFGSYFGSPWGSLGSIWGSTTTPVVTPTDTVTRTTGTTIATVQTDEEDNLSFLATDFAYLGGEVAASMQITDLPDHGTLEVDGHEVSLNETIGVDEFDNMDYIPDDDFDGTDTFSVKLSEDGATYDSSNSIIQINVLGENDAPELGSISTISVVEGETSSGVGSAIAAAFSDVDTNDYLDEVEIKFESGDHGKLTYESDYGGVISIEKDESDRLSAEELATLEFVADSGVADDSDVAVTIEVEAFDSEGSDSNTEKMTIKVTDGNDAPTFKDSSDGYDFDDVKADENQISLDLPSFPATDDENPYELTYSIVGVDADLFNVDSGNGEITFKNAPDYEDPQGSAGENEYTFTLIATDPNGATAQTDVVVEVEDVEANLSLKVDDKTAKNDDPTVTGAEVAVVEGSTIALTAKMNNDDISNEAKFSIGDGGVDGDLFTINEDTGELSFREVPDVENPQDDNGNSKYNVEILLSDEAGTELSVDVAIIVDDIHDEQPVLEEVSASDDSDFNLQTISESEFRLNIPETASYSSDVELLELEFNNGEDTDELHNKPDLSFSLLANNDSLLFKIEDTDDDSSDDSATATLSLIADAEIDYDEGDREYDLTVLVTDNDDGTTLETNVTVSLLPVSEPATYFGAKGVSVAVDSHVNIGENIAASVDDPEDDILVFTVSSPDDAYGYLQLGSFIYPQNEDVLISNDDIEDLEFHSESSSNYGLNDRHVDIAFTVVDVDGIQDPMIDGSISVYVEETV